ncbi:hypothetical protein [Amycolatopsis australiensis]|uniref:hypothetical protein n=1 Tax=Amycolatopsis australiensis TaxID=546364 RepID=UPI001FE7A2F4|nr:hypothetical protein [Amycolatopsis australiensis]
MLLVLAPVMLMMASPVNFLHHTSWQVDDIDDVCRGACAILGGHPERHVWGLDRHHAGSDFFLCLEDPAGNFSEYYSDMDCIPEDDIWKPWAGKARRALFDWGAAATVFLEPEDLAGLMTGQQTRG